VHVHVVQPRDQEAARTVHDGRSTVDPDVALPVSRR
jgi:hypothetical protein